MFYVAGYLWVRSNSFETTSAGLTYIVLGVTEDDLSLMIGLAFSDDADVSVEERHRAERIDRKAQRYGLLFAPLIWLDEKLTGTYIETDL